MTPYYESAGITIYVGDALELLPRLSPVDVIITDPVWPGRADHIFPGLDAEALWARAAQEFPRLCSRLIVILGCATDPRFLAHVPAALPFVRACWMRFIPPRYRGSVLNGADLAYVFGGAWLNGTGTRVLPGEVSSQYDPSTARHDEQPCPRNQHHLRWLVGH